MEDPLVFLDYDQAALDAAYDQAAYAPNREQLIKRRIRDSELARHRIGEPERVAYGSGEIERLDIYRRPHISIEIKDRLGRVVADRDG
jgi:arylformamidase